MSTKNKTTTPIKLWMTENKPQYRLDNPGIKTKELNILMTSDWSSVSEQVVLSYKNKCVVSVSNTAPSVNQNKDDKMLIKSWMTDNKGQYRLDNPGIKTKDLNILMLSHWNTNDKIREKYKTKFLRKSSNKDSTENSTAYEPVSFTNEKIHTRTAFQIYFDYCLYKYKPLNYTTQE